MQTLFIPSMQVYIRDEFKDLIFQRGFYSAIIQTSKALQLQSKIIWFII